jgi:hypothetical protein
LLLTFGALVIILAVCVYQWRQSNLRYSEFIAREKPLSESFHAVYQKLMGGKPVVSADAFIRPCDVRKALARGPNDLGELPPWVASDGVYISRADVPVNSRRFICFIRVDDTNTPYGLTSDGECRNADTTEIFQQDFVSLRPTEGH